MFLKQHLNICSRAWCSQTLPKVFFISTVCCSSCILVFSASNICRSHRYHTSRRQMMYSQVRCFKVKRLYLHTWVELCKWTCQSVGSTWFWLQIECMHVFSLVTRASTACYQPILSASKQCQIAGLYFTHAHIRWLLLWLSYASRSWKLQNHIFGF